MHDRGTQLSGGHRPYVVDHARQLESPKQSLHADSQRSSGYDCGMTAAEFFTVTTAVYAAIVATFVLVWDIVKWAMQGPNLRVEVQSGMRLYGGGVPNDRTYVVLRVTNRGDRPTTITNMGYLLYRDDWVAKVNRNGTMFKAIVPDPSPNQPLPYTLAPGAQWVGVGWQDDEITRMARGGCLMCSVHHSHANKPVRRQIIVHDSAEFSPVNSQPQ